MDHAGADDLLMVVEGVPRFNHRTDSVGLAHHWNDYFDGLCRFVSELRGDLRNALIVRLSSTDQGRGEADRWEARVPDVRLDRGGVPMNELISGCRLYVATYNSTTYLQTFTMDVPTVCFWDPARWQVRPAAESYFRRMVEVGILHHDPVSAARHVAAIWDDVGSWWYSDEVMEVRGVMSRRFSHLPDDLRTDVVDAIQKVLQPRWPSVEGSVGSVRGS